MFKKFKTTSRLRMAVALAAFASLPLAQPAHAVPILDQQNVFPGPGPGGSINTVNGSFFWAQSFTAGMTGQWTQLDLFATTDPNNLTLEFYAGTPETFGSALYSTTAAFAGNSGWNSVNLAAGNLSVTAGQQYTFVMRTNAPGAGSNGLAYNSQGDTYAGGQLYIGFAAFPDFPLSPFNENRVDLVFRTYVDSGGASVPEPASLSLMGLGLLAAGGMRRRRKSPTIG